jgi:hypothetical protein
MEIRAERGTGDFQPFSLVTWLTDPEDGRENWVWEAGGKCS